MVRKNPAVPARQNFLQGALLLTLGVLVVKVIGALFKIPLAAVITEEGMGYFGTAYSFYNVLFSLSAAGFPAAVSRMVSEQESLGRWRDVRCIRKTALPLFLAVGAAGTLIMVCTAPLYTKLVGNPGALPAMLVLSPCVLLCSGASVYRGFHEGLHNMVPTTVSQVIEALCKLLFGLTAASFVLYTAGTSDRNIDKLFGDLFAGTLSREHRLFALGAAAAIAGVSIGSAASLIYLFLYDRKKSAFPAENPPSAVPYTPKKVIRTLVSTAVPIAVGSVAMSVSGLIDASFLQTRAAYILRTDPAPLLSMYAGSIPQENLQSPQTIPNYLFGCYNMALTLFMLIPSITQAFGVCALPNVTGTYARRDRTALKKSIETVIRAACIFSFPAGVGLSVLAYPISRFVYGNSMGASIVAKALTVMGFASVFAAVTTPLGSLLQAVGQIELPVILTLSGLLVKVLLNFLLAGIPQVNILAGGISTLISCFLLTVAETVALQKVTGLRFKISHLFLKPAGAALLCGVSAKSLHSFLLSRGLQNGPSVVLSVFAAAVVYGAALAVMKGISKEDLALFSGREKIRKKERKYLKNIGG